MFFIDYHVTLFPSLAIANFLHFSHLGITFTQCATMFPEKNFIVIIVIIIIIIIIIIIS